MSFSNRMSHVKRPCRRDVACNVLPPAFGVQARSEPLHARRSKLRLYGQARDVAEDQLVAVNRGLWPRSGHWRGSSQSIRHFGDENVSCKTRYVQPIHHGKIRKCNKEDAGDHEPPRSYLDKSQWHRDSCRGDAQGDEVRESSPGAHGRYWSGSLPEKTDCGGDGTQCVLAVADSEYAGQ